MDSVAFYRTPCERLGAGLHKTITNYKPMENLKYRVKKENPTNLPVGTELEYDESIEGILFRGMGNKWYVGADAIKNSNWFEPIPKVEAGQYWEWSTGKVFRVQEVYPETKRCQIKYLHGVKTQYYWNSITDNATLLSDSEVQQALIEEGERRGLAKGKKIKSARSEEDLFWNREGKIHYKQATDELIVSGANEGFAIVLYRQGQWAEIIADEWEVIEEPFRQVTNGERCISTISPVPLPKEEAETIAKALNR